MNDDDKKETVKELSTEERIDNLETDVRVNELTSIYDKEDTDDYIKTLSSSIDILSVGVYVCMFFTATALVLLMRKKT